MTTTTTSSQTSSGQAYSGTSWSSYSTGHVVTYEESGTFTRRAHPHNGYSSGFSPSRSQWREPERTADTIRAA
jgi:hypothetical protein